MKKLVFTIVIIFILCSISVIYANVELNSANKVISSGPVFQEPIVGKIIMSVDKAVLSAFFKKYPNLKEYQSEVNSLYKKRKYAFVWYDEEGLIEFANLLYSKVNRLDEEGLETTLPYKDKIDEIFDGESTKKLSQTDTEILLSSMYVYYAQTVYKGIDSKKIAKTGWFLPLKSLSLVNLLDSLAISRLGLMIPG
jgi:murein L,D-transpeptidase YcbB/YkuD